MKTNFRILGVLLVLLTSFTLFPKTTKAQQDYVSFQVFYDELSPYGQWIDYPQYGYAWLPDVNNDFMPYSTNGQWIFTDYGWTWASGYEWGWAPFHYGRWDYDTYYGWLWVPDYEWGPSWVTWRSASGYYGWQPMRPGISISFSFGNEYYNSYNDHWMFVRDRDFQRPNVSRYDLDQPQRDRIIRKSTVINNTYMDNRRNTTYISGPGRNDVQRSTGKRVNSVTIQENTRPGQDLSNGKLRIYRPQVRNNNDQGKKPAPERITNMEQVRRPAGRSGTNQQRNVIPVNNNSRELQPNIIRKKNSDKVEQPAQQRINENSSDDKHERQQNQEIQRNTEDNKTKPTVAPTENKRNERQQDVVPPQNNRMNAQPAKPNVQQTEPGKQELQQKNVTPKNTKRNRQTKEAKVRNTKKKND